MSRYPKKEVSTDDLEINTQSSIVLPNTGSIKDAIAAAEDHELDVVDASALGDKTQLQLLRFNEEIVTIVVHESANETDITVPGVWVNGRSQYFIRGMALPVKRMFVEALARAKTMTVKTKTGHRDGEAFQELSRTSAVRYPFSLIEDKNPRGGQPWLNKLLAEN